MHDMIDDMLDMIEGFVHSRPQSPRFVWSALKTSARDNCKKKRGPLGTIIRDYGLWTVKKCWLRTHHGLS